MGTTTYTTFNGMLVHENRGGVETEYVPDTLGSVMMCRDVNGNTTYTADYWPYGEVAVSSGTNPSPWSFVGTLGYYTDSAPGSLYVRARTLLPLYGRWATVDPVWPRVAPYSYAGNQPILYSDPSGRIIPVLIYGCVLIIGGLIVGGCSCSTLPIKCPHEGCNALCYDTPKSGTWKDNCDMCCGAMWRGDEERFEQCAHACVEDGTIPCQCPPNALRWPLPGTLPRVA
jgi:RHS repeat-associated protein